MPGDEIVPSPSGENGSPAVPSNPPWVDQLLQNQALELQLRADQQALAKQQSEQSHEFAKLSLDAQATDRREWREMYSGIIDRVSWRIIIVVGLVLGFLATLVLSGHEQIALELLRVAIYGGFGALGGYGYHASKSKKSGSEQ